jgi:hypothetical protein
LALMGNAQSGVIVSGLDSEGVSLDDSNSQNFVNSLDPDRDTKADVLLPYSVLMTNHSERKMMAYSLTWRCRDNAGKVVSQNITRWDFRTFSKLDPGSSKLFSIVAGVGTRSTDSVERIRTFADFYRQQKSINVQLDLVVFADGRAAGPDPDLWLPKLRAWMEAERDLHAAVAALHTQGEVESLVESAVRGVDLSDPGKTTADLFRRANVAGSYSEAYSLAHTYFAAWMALGARTEGYEAVLQQARRNVSLRQYPVIHR